MHRLEAKQTRGVTQKHGKGWVQLTQDHKREWLLSGADRNEYCGEVVRVTSPKGKVWYGLAVVSPAALENVAPLVDVMGLEGKRIPGRFQGKVIRLKVSDNPRQAGSRCSPPTRG